MKTLLLKLLFLATVLILLSGCAVYTPIPEVAVVAPLGPVYVDPLPPIIIEPFYPYPYTYQTPYFNRLYAPRMYRNYSHPGPIRGPGPRR